MADLLHCAELSRMASQHNCLSLIEKTFLNFCVNFLTYRVFFSHLLRKVPRPKFWVKKKFQSRTTAIFLVLLYPPRYPLRPHFYILKYTLRRSRISKRANCVEKYAICVTRWLSGSYAGPTFPYMRVLYRYKIFLSKGTKLAQIFIVFR